MISLALGSCAELGRPSTASAGGQIQHFTKLLKSRENLAVPGRIKPLIEHRPVRRMPWPEWSAGPPGRYPDRERPFAATDKLTNPSAVQWRGRTGLRALSARPDSTRLPQWSEKWCPGTELNRRHCDFQSVVLTCHPVPIQS